MLPEKFKAITDPFNAIDLAEMDSCLLYTSDAADD